MKRARIATGGLRAHQDTCSLADYEDRANQAYRKYSETCEAAAAAAEKKANAEKAYSEAANKCYCGEPNEEDWKELTEASKALADARKEEKAATKAMEEAADEAQLASDWVEVKKRELRRSARNDTTYVVHCARIECTYGMRESYLALKYTHGVITRQIPQMTTKDTVLDTNIINFGGCRSRENPSLHEAARQAAAQANEIIEEETGWGGKLIDALFCRNEEIKVSDSLLAKCIGECKACLPENIEWVGGHEKVFINGEPVLLRKCRLRCMYGGQITILLSGQPE